jgi:hypothetical protein
MLPFCKAQFIYGGLIMFDKSILFSSSLGVVISLFWGTQIAQAVISKTYNEFTGKTTISVTPDWSTWKGSPTLYLKEEFQEKTPTEKPGLLFFRVIAPIRHYAECGRGVTGVIADGERVLTADERTPALGRFGFPNIEPLGRTNPRLNQYISLFARYKFEDFQRIAQANKVVYQLCDDSAKVFQLTEQEQQDLRAYLKAITP